MFANKVVLVTGGGAGIGAATVQAFAKEGASVAIVDRNEPKLKEVAKRCEQYGAKTLAIKADISKDEEAKTIVQQTVDKFGKLDVLVNNAGIQRFASLLEPNLVETYDLIMNTNLRAMVHITNLAVPHLIKTKGNVVNMSSIASSCSVIPNAISYSISKAGIDQFTRYAAKELASSGVRVNSVNPGPVITDIVVSAGNAPEGFSDDMLASLTGLGRCSEPEEIADLILYLASDKAKSITGSHHIIDNGSLLM